MSRQSRRGTAGRVRRQRLRTCHTIFAEQVKASPHWEAFAQLDLPGCVTCHENHAVVAPTDAYFSTGKDGKCVDCHETGTEGARSAAAMHENIVTLEKQILAAKAALQREAEAGMLAQRARSTFRAPTKRSRARADVHLFQPYAVRQTAAGGLTIAARLAQPRCCSSTSAVSDGRDSSWRSSSSAFPSRPSS